MGRARIERGRSAVPLRPCMIRARPPHAQADPGPWQSTRRAGVWGRQTKGRAAPRERATMHRCTPTPLTGAVV